MPECNIFYNYNHACVQWSKSKGLHHIQMKENQIQDNIMSKFVIIHHVDGLVYFRFIILIHEMKDTSHFVTFCDLFMHSWPIT